MPRLQCPHCQKIVKLDHQTFTVHEVVRCASCQGLIPVKQAVAEEPKRTRKQHFARKSNSSHTALFIGLGLLILLTVVISLIIYLNTQEPQETLPLAKADEQQPAHVPFQPAVPAPTRSSPPSAPATNLTFTQLWNREESLLEQIVQLMQSIRTADDAKAAVPKMKKLRADLAATRKQKDQAAETMPKEEWTELLPRYARQAEREQNYDQRYRAESDRLSSNPAFAPYLDGLFDTSVGVNRFDFGKNPRK
jgi:hypothetical protein